MLDALKTALEATGYAFAMYGWSHAPEGDYGVISCTGANDLEADDQHVEGAILASVDYFTRDVSKAPKLAIEAALNASGAAWALDSVLFEEETGFIHWSWDCEVLDDGED